MKWTYLIAILTIVLNSTYRVDAATYDSDGLATLPSSSAIPPALGEGVDISTGGLRPSVCVHGTQTTENPGGPAPQSKTVHIEENSDASSVFHEMGVSVAAQASFVTGSINATANYITAHKYTSDETSFSIYATVEQRTYFAPIGAQLAGFGAPDLKTSATLSLDPTALALLKRHNLAGFKARCGDGFVALLVQGADLLATLTVHNYVEQDTTNKNASMKAEAYGDSVSASIHDTVDSLTKNHASKLDVLANGGSGSPAPVSETDLITAVEKLPDSAKAAPETVRIVVRSYRSLPDWPKGVEFTAVTDPLDRLMSTYWRVDAMLAQCNETLAQPSAFAMGFNTAWQVHLSPNQPPGLLKLCDAIKTARGRLFDQISKCAPKRSCTAPVLSNIDIYKLAVQLPVPLQPPTQTLQSWQTQDAAMQTYVSGFDQAKIAIVAANWNIADNATCYNHNHVMTQALAGGFPPAILRQQVLNYETFLNGLPAQFRDDAVDLYVRTPAHRNCYQSPTDADCSLSESDIVNTGQSVPLKNWTVFSTNLDLNNPQSIEEWNPPCTFGSSPLLTVGWSPPH